MLFERQLDLEEMIREQQALLRSCREDTASEEGEDRPFVMCLRELEERTSELLKESVK